MSQSSSRIDAALEELQHTRGWSPLGEIGDEGEARRWRVRAHGQPALLYMWPDPAMAHRSAWAHGDAVGDHLFVVPPLIEAGHTWCLVGDVDGVPLPDYLAGEGASSLVDLGGERARLIARAIGQTARKLHEVDVPAEFGDVLEGGHLERDGTLGRWKTFNGYCAHHLERFAEHVRHAEVGDATRARLLTSIGDLRNQLSAFHPRHPPSLNHGRLIPAHLWVDSSGRDVVGLTGFSRARLLPSEADLAPLLWLYGLGDDDALVRAFYSGYGAARTMDLQRRERFYRRLVALEALVDGGERRLDDGQLVELACGA